MVGGTALPAHPAWSDVVRGALRGAGTSFEGVRWIRGAYGALTGTPHQPAIDQIVGGLMISPDVALRAGAIYVVWSALDMPSTDLLPPVLKEDAEGLQSEVDPHGQGSLYDLTAGAIAYHIDRGRWPYATFKAVLRQLVLTPGHAGGCGWLLARSDPAWFLDQADLLVERSPLSAEKIERWRQEAARFVR